MKEIPVAVAVPGVCRAPEEVVDEFNPLDVFKAALPPQKGDSQEGRTKAKQSVPTVQNESVLDQKPQAHAKEDEHRQPGQAIRSVDPLRAGPDVFSEQESCPHKDDPPDEPLLPETEDPSIL